MIKMASATVETICFQDEIPVILNTSFELETYIKGHRVYKEVWTSKEGRKYGRFFTSSEVIPTVTVMLKFQGNDAT